MIVDGGMRDRINNIPGVRIRITRWPDGDCHIHEYRAKGKYRYSKLSPNGNMDHGNCDY